MGYCEWQIILRAAGKNNLGICDEVWHSMIRSDREKK